MILKISVVALVALAAALAACSSPDEERASTSEPSAPTPPTQPQPTIAYPTPMPERVGPKQWDSPPAMTIDSSKKYTAVFNLAKGDKFEVELYADKVPMTVNNFVFLAREGYYDGVTFHRVLANFMAQSGDPTGTGTGGPGYRFDNEFHPDLRHDSEGIMSMANAGERNGSGTNGSQFFITFRAVTQLDGLNPDGSPKSCSASGVSCHSVFGKVSSGMDVVNGITLRDPSTATSEGDVVTSIKIVEE